MLTMLVILSDHQKMRIQRLRNGFHVLHGAVSVGYSAQGAHVFFLQCALPAVIRIRYARAPTDHTATFIGAIITFVTDAY